jgi:hypothetical protein
MTLPDELPPETTPEWTEQDERLLQSFAKNDTYNGRSPRHRVRRRTEAVSEEPRYITRENAERALR